MQYDEEDVADIVSAVQTGDFEVIEDVISRNFIDASACDKDGCSLLHWAAINNRYEIASLLIQHGAKVNTVGGVLGELPLAWAVRKKFHAMTHLLLAHNSDVNHTSRTKLTVLHLALKLGDVDMVYLLLQHGANPNATDANGDPIAIWLLKARPRPHPELYAAYMRLLMNFDCNLATSVEAATGSTVMHLLTAAIISGSSSSSSISNNSSSGSSGAGSLDLLTDGGMAGLSSGLLGLGMLQQADADAVAVMCMACDKMGVDAAIFEPRNQDGQTPFNLAWSVHHAALVKQFYDLWLLHHTPRWLPVTAATTATLLLFYWLRHFGLASWSFWVYTIVVDGALIALLTQASLTYRLGRIAFGASLGAAGAAYIGFLVYVEDLLGWRGSRTVAVVALVCQLLSMLVFYCTPARHLVNSSRVCTMSSIGTWGSGSGAVSVASANSAASSRHFSRGLLGGSGDGDGSGERELRDRDRDRDVEAAGGDVNITGADGGRDRSLSLDCQCSAETLVDEMLRYKNEGRMRGPNTSQVLPAVSPMHRSYSSNSAAGMVITNSGGAGSSSGSRDPSRSNSVNNFEALCGSTGDSSSGPGGRGGVSPLQRSGSQGSLGFSSQEKDGPRGRAAHRQHHGGSGRRDPVCGFRLCTSCLVNAAAASAHCPCCNACVVEVDHHSEMLGNCVGHGNRRMYCCVLLMGTITGLLFATAALVVQFNGGGGSQDSKGSGATVQGGWVVHNYLHVCDDAYGYGGDESSSGRWGMLQVVGQVLMVQRCMLELFPCFFVLTWGSVATAVYCAAALYRQLLFVAHGTTTFEEARASATTAMAGGAVPSRVLSFATLTRETVFNALSRFIWNGSYRVVRQEVGAVGNAAEQVPLLSLPPGTSSAVR